MFAKGSDILRRHTARVLFAVLCAGCGGVQAQAQVAGVVNNGVPDGGVQISPIRFEADVRPGDVWRGTLNLKNFSSEIRELTLSAEDFVVTDDTQNITFYPSDQARHLQVPDIADWVVLPQRTVTLAGNATAAVPFELHIPPNAPTGGYYGALFVTQSRTGSYDTQTGQAQIGINSRMGALLIFAVHGSEPARVEGTLTAFGPTQKVFFVSPVRFRTSIANNGTIHFRGSGAITLARGGKTIATLPLASQVNYPHKVRTYASAWHFGLLDMGPYTATVRYESLSGLVTLEATEVFWVVPWSAIAIVVGIVILLVALRFYIKKNYVIQRR